MSDTTIGMLSDEQLADIRQRLADGQIIVFGWKTVAALVSMLDSERTRAASEVPVQATSVESTPVAPLRGVVGHW